jgi:pyruvate carboxylase
VSGLWTRDQYIGWPKLPEETDRQKRLLAQKNEAVDMWEKIVKLADSINFPDKETAEFVRVSCRYGLHLYRIYRCVFNLAALEKSDDKTAIQRWITEYDRAWKDYVQLKDKNPCCATLYSRTELKRSSFNPAADVKVEKMRKILSSQAVEQETKY